ncbi:MAG: hydroxymyristoyl-ACP dehydratase [Gammaproteobacteria bacterium]|nr:hydroxymyristoyl-ACP dehydratase [Gammaproteobacteria bacterium]
MTRAVLDRAALAALVPHAGAMCLLDGVLAWDEWEVRCHSRSHLAADNPLRGAHGLAAIHAVEYAAQAMAVHGALLGAGAAARSLPGYLAALNDVALGVARLDDVEATLEVMARRLVIMGRSMLYAFEVSAGGRLLARGRASVAAPAGEAA